MGKSKFQNQHIENTHRSLLDPVLWKLGYYDDPVPKLPPPADFIYPASADHFNPLKPSAVWIGHSTYLIQVDGLVILTDPIWDSYCSPIRLPIFRRYTNPPIPLSELPHIDLVLISHNHYDHLDSRTVAILHRLHPQIQWIVPEGLSPWFLRREIQTVSELGWWENLSIFDCSITAVPTQHFSGRTLWDQNKTHWNGYVIQTKSKTLYFVGDTGYNGIDFKAIGKKFPFMDLSLIPIGAYSPEKFMSPVHIGPYEAVQIHQEVHSRFSLGMHWNTFCLSEEPIESPPYDLYLSMEKKRLPFETFLPIDIGTYVNF